MTQIMIVDDQEQNLYMLQVLLQGHGYEVVPARNGIEALELARRRAPDLIITDILMPGMDGFGLCRAWMADDDLRHVPLVFYTATYTDTKDEAFALSLGAARFIVKPAEPDALIEILRQVLESHASQRLPSPDGPLPTEEVYYQQYNQALIRKLEDKMAQLEETNRALELDIAARKQVEADRERLLAEIAEQAQNTEQVLATVPAGVLLLDAHWRVVMANPTAEANLAILANAHVGDVLTHLGDRPLGELLTSPPTVGLWHEIKTETHVFEMITRPVARGAEPEPYVLVINDVTREREIRGELQQQERLAAVGQLAAGIAHDFNNVLAVIMLYAQMDVQAPDIPDRLRAHLQTIAQETQHAASLVQQILDFGRSTVLEPRRLDLVSFLEERVTLFKRTLPESITIEFHHPLDDVIVRADPTRMQQMITNLAINARDAMPEGGKLLIRLEKIRLEQSMPLHGMAPGPWIRITVGDTGSGITPEAQRHLFEPFFTTKEPGKGTGLGLAQVYGIVKQHEGHIGMHSQVGQGTTFTIYLPAFEAELPADQPVMRSTLPPAHGELILVVEDNVALRGAVVSTLKLLNYRVLEAANGREALELLGQHESEVSLILSDMVMPEMGGRALFYTLRERGSRLPMVIMTGHSARRDLLVLQELGLAGWVLKPPTVETLAETLSRALHG